VLHIHYSNDISQLVDVVAEVIARPRAHLLAAEQIVVDDTRTGGWLNQALSDRLGVAANIEYRLPGQFLWSVVGRVLPELPERVGATPEILRWMIYARFRHIDDDEGLRNSVLARYVRQATNLEQYELAGQLAHCYDQYALLRPDWLRRWEAGGDRRTASPSEGVAAHGGDDEWDAVLWRTLTADRNLWHWARVVEAFQSRIGGFDGPDLGERVIVFVPQSLSPGYLTILNGIAAFTDVYVPCFNPSQEYWGDIVAPQTLDRLTPDDDSALYFEVGNRLLASMGRPGRDFVDALQSLESRTSEGYQPRCRAGALGRVQHDILTLSEDALEGASSEDDGAGAIGSREGSGRVTVHSCHSPIREAEVLLDSLLGAWMADPGLAYDDICVLTPDVDRYGPLVEAVFQTSKQRIPVHYPAKGSTRVLGIADGLRMLVRGELDDLPVTGVLNLLRIPALAKQYSIDESDRQALRRQLGDAKVHRFFDGAQRESGRSEGTFTWTFGNDRTLLGYLSGPRFRAPGEATSQDDSREPHFAGIAPLSETGPAEVERFDRLMTLVEDLYRLNGRLREWQAPVDWGCCVRACLQTLFEPAAGDEIEHAQILRVVDDYVNEVAAGLDVSSTSAVAPPEASVVDPEVLGAGLSESLARVSAGGGRSNAAMGLRVAPLAWGELRPCKLLCLVGMNQDLFPRRSTRPSFDRMLADRRRGDRSPRDDDRYVFLRACMTPSHELFISYCGQDVVSNEERPMASVVNELCDYLGAMSSNRAIAVADVNDGCDAPDHPQPVVRHPLHSYDRRYFSDEDPDIYTFQDVPFEIAETLSNATREPIVFWSESREGGGIESRRANHAGRFELDDVLALFRAPTRWMLQEHCAVRYLEIDDALSSREPIQLDPLSSYQLMSFLAGRPDEGDDLAAATAAGLVPLGRIGEWYLRDGAERAAPMRGYLADAWAGATSKWLEASSGAIPIAGTVRFSGSGDVTVLRPGRLRPQDYVGAWVQHLFVCSACPRWHGRTMVVATQEFAWFESGDTLDSAEAKALLGDVLRVAQQAQQRPLLMEPILAWEASTRARSRDVDHEAPRQRRVRVAWLGSGYPRGIGEGQHVARLFSGQLEQRMDELLEFSHTIYEPMRKRVRQSRWEVGSPSEFGEGGAS
jgi:exodeoxyribonuclease V gamma subunit